MPALLLYGLDKPCDRNGYPVVGKPTMISPWWTLCACPSCLPATDTLIKKMESKGTVERFTIRARNQREAVQEGRRLSIWAKDRIKEEARTRPASRRRRKSSGKGSSRPLSSWRGWQLSDPPQAR